MPFVLAAVAIVVVVVIWVLFAGDRSTTIVDEEPTLNTRGEGD